ncbi:GRP family sugar transporter [Flavihumibacter petaseus]|uniref:Putative glucose uptake protein n=1 Tax=Flavihumibacter petaseus NBRC 106054 TaxID=1220578 RepID=A0A0E9MWQ3_9BACT|nr:GRP family sugar transporter [Flavihumibacter petaseus]GAO41923.1 putative glucose uptake protein [Flavihumibacter petaseus NBRC 106054]
MAVTDWLIACIPILSFGIVPVIATKMGGTAIDQAMGIALGGFIFALSAFLLLRPALTSQIFVIGAISGLCWAIGSVGQFIGMHHLGVSLSIPISCAGQIIGTSVLGMILGDWATAASKGYGITALILIIGGTALTSYKQQQAGQQLAWRKGLMANLISSLGFTAYAGLLKYYRIGGWESLLPQSMGQIAGVLLIASLVFRRLPKGAAAGRNIFTGLVWAGGNLSLLLSTAKIGLAVAYPVSQAATIVSVLGGVFLNHEKKSRREWVSAIAGMLIIVAGLYLIYLSSRHDSKPEF